MSFNLGLSAVFICLDRGSPFWVKLALKWCCAHPYNLEQVIHAEVVYTSFSTVRLLIFPLKWIRISWKDRNCTDVLFIHRILPVDFSIHHVNVNTLVTQSCPALCDCNPPGSYVLGILQARILEWVAISFSRGSSQPALAFIKH